MSDPIDESFHDTTKLIIKQKFEPLEALANAAAEAIGLDALGRLGETANKYDVFTDDGGLKFRVVEESEYCGLTGRCCCRPNHKLQLHIYHGGEEVLYVQRGCKCGQCCTCAPCCQQEMHVFQGPGEGELIAHIQEPLFGGGFSPTLQVMDRDGEDVATIKANAFCFIGGMCCDHTFSVEDPNGEDMGKIVKERPESLGQLATEIVSDADIFTMHVPKDLDSKKKAAMLAALHLVDYWLFEDEGSGDLNLNEQSLACKLCDCYCFGCVCPCSCKLGGGDGDGGDGDGEGGDFGDSGGGDFGGDFGGGEE